MTKPPPALPLPRPTKLLQKFGDVDLLPVHGSTQGYRLTDTRLIGEGRSLLITDVGGVHRDFGIEDCVFEGHPKRTNKVHWGARVYTWDGYVKRSWFRNISLQHAFYANLGYGNVLFEEVRFTRVGAQGPQLKWWPTEGTPPKVHTFDPALRTVHRIVEVRRCVALECGLPSGAGRASFFWKMDGECPETTFVLDDNYLRTIDQAPHDGQGRRSFGGTFFGRCKSGQVYGGYTELLKPDKALLQSYDYAQPDKGAEELIIDGHEIWGGNVHVDCDTSNYVRIQGCKGNAQLVLHKNGSVWKTQSFNIAYAQG